jgi:O-antigen ligase
MCGYFMITAVILWGDRTPLEVRMWGGAVAFAGACFLKADSDEFRTHFWRALATSAILLALLATSQGLLGGPLFQGVEEPRDLIRLLVFGDTHPVRLANLTFQHFNSAGAYLTILVAMLYAGAITRRSRLLWIGLTAALLALYLTYSRGAALSSIIAILIATALVRADRRERVMLGASAAIAVTLILRFALPAALRSEYSGTLSLGVRALIWQAYFQAWWQSPLIGLGPGNGFAAAQFLSPYGEEYGAHNNYLYLAADFGMLGLAALGYGLGAAVIRTVRMDPATRATQSLAVGATGALAALIVHGFFDHTLVVFSYRVALLGVVAAACAIAGRPRPSG